MAVFESKEDLINKCDYYLEHDNERRQIAANGFGKVNEFHTYKVRLKRNIRCSVLKHHTEYFFPCT